MGKNNIIGTWTNVTDVVIITKKTVWVTETEQNITWKVWLIISYDMLYIWSAYISKWHECTFSTHTTTTTTTTNTNNIIKCNKNNMQ